MYTEIYVRNPNCTAVGKGSGGCSYKTSIINSQKIVKKKKKKKKKYIYILQKSLVNKACQ